MTEPSRLMVLVSRSRLKVLVSRPRLKGSSLSEVGFVALALVSALGCADKAPPARFPDPPPPELAKPLPPESEPIPAAESTPTAEPAEDVDNSDSGPREVDGSTHEDEPAPHVR